MLIIMNNMYVYGIDPGLVNTAIVLLDQNGMLVKHKLIKTKSTQPLANRLNHIYEEIRSFTAGQPAGLFAIEETIVGKGMRSALLLAHGRAAAILGLPKGVEIMEIPPTVIKKHFAGTGGADKVYMKKILGLEKNTSNNDFNEHVIDAIAVARTAQWLQRAKTAFHHPAKGRTAPRRSLLEISSYICMD